MWSFKRCKRGQFLAPTPEFASSQLQKASLAVPLPLWCSCSPVAHCISQSRKQVKSSESLQQDLFYSQAADQDHFQEDAVVTKNNETDSCSKAPTAKQQQSFTHDPFWYAVVSHSSWENVFDVCHYSPSPWELQGKVCLTEDGPAKCQGLLSRGKRADTSAEGAK